MSLTTCSLSPTMTRRRIRLTIRGVVQGVGFRPFVYRLAHQLSLSGWIVNSPEGAIVEVEGHLSAIETFRERLQTQAPPAAKIEEIASLTIPHQGDQTFTIRTSWHTGNRQSVISPDLATCVECLDEIRNPRSRRYRYPFTTCTRCGPRFSIVQNIPYDRTNTTMRDFTLCEACDGEFKDMANRRFHAETNACPVCGPQVFLWDQHGTILAAKEEALQQACQMVFQGKILAVKGLGGFQLWVDAVSEKAVQQLRLRKHRPKKPFAVLFPSVDILRDHCLLSPEEEKLLTSPEAPIVLLRRKNTSSLTPLVAPDNPYIGALVPYTPLHHLLMADRQTPVVATSGNQSEEPIVIDEYEALTHLKGIADAFLVHDRPIARPVDDSVVHMVQGNMLMLRRARGYVPNPILTHSLESMRITVTSVLALGGHLKNTITVTTPSHMIVSQHIGDLSTVESFTQFTRTITDQLKLFDVHPQAIACDLHPDYKSTVFAHQLGKELDVPVIPVQHHHAHIVACMAEHGVQGPVLGVAWDGAGYGPDDTLWGGEFLICDDTGFRRMAHISPFHLPGGEVSMMEPRRVALSLLAETFGDNALQLDLPPLRSLGSQLSSSLVSLMGKGVCCPLTTSIGRLFDGISSILGLCQRATFEGEAAVALQFLAEQCQDHPDNLGYIIPLSRFSSSRERGKSKEDWQAEDTWIADWRPLVKALINDVLAKKDPEHIAHAFHRALRDLILQLTGNVGLPSIVLSGGVFQNTLLLELTRNSLAQAGHLVYAHHQIPPNDGGVALGQAVIARHALSDGVRH